MIGFGPFRERASYAPCKDLVLINQIPGFTGTFASKGFPSWCCLRLQRDDILERTGALDARSHDLLRGTGPDETIFTAYLPYSDTFKEAPPYTEDAAHIRAVNRTLRRL